MKKANETHIRTHAHTHTNGPTHTNAHTHIREEQDYGINSFSGELVALERNSERHFNFEL